MAKSNRDRVSEVMDALKDGLAPFIVSEFARVYKGRLIQEINDGLTSGVYGGLASTTAEGAVREMDVQACLNLIMRRWDQVFKTKLGKSERGYTNILSDVRNEWAHQSAFSNDQAYEAADIARRLLESISAPQQAQICRDIAQDLLRLRFEAEQKQSQKPSPTISDAPLTTKAGLKPWRMVVQPHPDVATGRYAQAEFAADLAQVVSGRADPEYSDPREFFRRTYLTEGLVDLLANGLSRLTGNGGDPVVQLQTSFGGGKTHSMLAMYHLFGGNIKVSEIPGGEAIVQRVPSVDNRLEARRAVIVGTAFDPAKPRVYADCTTHTLWGDIAYQLGGVAAYQLVEQADLTGVSPGSDTLVELFEQHGPSLIIIDELVAFARNIYSVTERLSAGSFDAVMTFMQSLTEAVKRSSDSLLLISIPASDMEIGGEGGFAALDILAKTIGRVESVWKPVTATEAYEIVRRRLFSTEIDYPARDAVLSAFREIYAQNTSEFPSGVSENDYITRMRAAYPIHPELFERLYEDWSTLDRFQRTRGVLRFMSAVIHRLWQDNDTSLLIMPGSVPLWNPVIRNEILRYLPDNWPAIVEADIDGQGSKPYDLDSNVTTLTRYMAARRVARTIFIGSAPSVAGQSVRGLEEVRIRLGTVQPGEPSAVFGDALRRMTNQSAYLYLEGSRYWYDTRPTVNRIAQDRAQAISPDEVYHEQLNRLKAVPVRPKNGSVYFTGVHVTPKSSGNVSDEKGVRVVVLSPEYGHRKGNGDSDAQREARDILENRGGAPRRYRNMLVFIASDAANLVEWEKAVREYLAWTSIQNDTDALNLDAQQRKQVENNCKRTDDTVVGRLRETYCWLIVPTQPDPIGPIEYQAQRIANQDNFYDMAARKLRSDGNLIYSWSPDILKMELDNYLWREQNHLSLKQLWEYLASYCYLPRLFNDEVLQNAIKDGVSRDDAPFGYATLVTDNGLYKGLVIRHQAASVYFDEHSVIIRSEAADAQLEAEYRSREDAVTAYRPAPTASNHEGAAHQPSTAQPRLTTRYHGTVSIDPQRVNKDMAVIVEEIIQRLTGLRGTDVTITLEIEASRPSGFDDATIRTINENSRTLKFRHHGFEED